MAKPIVSEETCSECGNPCFGSFQDLGIGSYEYWGQKCRDRNIQYVSDCCDAVIEVDGADYEPEDPRDEYNPEDRYY